MGRPVQRRMAGIMLLSGVAAVLCGGCVAGPNQADPWEKTNRGIYNFNDGVDRVVLKPVADGYVKVVPKPIRNGIGNGFDNLVYFNVVFCDLLEAKWGQGLGDFGRFAINSTIGIGGIFDPATPWGLPAHENDFGVVLGKWGFGPGPYLVLPLLGPSTVRDVPGYGVEYAATPTTYLGLPICITLPLGTTDVIDLRSRSDVLVKFRSQTALDPYVFTREAYLQYRESKIHEGKAATDEGFYDEDGEGATTRPASVGAATREGE